MHQRSPNTPLNPLNSTVFLALPFKRFNTDRDKIWRSGTIRALVSGTPKASSRVLCSRATAIHSVSDLQGQHSFTAGFRRTRKGGLARDFDGQLLTVFRRPDDLFKYCISGEDGRKFSEGTYDEEGDAICALFEVVDG